MSEAILLGICGLCGQTVTADEAPEDTICTAMNDSPHPADEVRWSWTAQTRACAPAGWECARVPCGKAICADIGCMNTLPAEEITAWHERGGRLVSAMVARCELELGRPLNAEERHMSPNQLVVDVLGREALPAAWRR